MRTNSRFGAQYAAFGVILLVFVGIAVMIAMRMAGGRTAIPAAGESLYLPTGLPTAEGLFTLSRNSATGAFTLSGPNLPREVTGTALSSLLPGAC